MSDTYVKLSNVVEPEVFNRAVYERVMDTNTLLNSGVMEDISSTIYADPRAQLVHMPFWTPLSGDAEVWPTGDDDSLTVNNMEQDQEIAVRRYRAKAFGYNSIVRYVEGSDPAGALANFVGNYWAAQLNADAFSTMKGAIQCANMISANKFLDLTDTETGSASNITVDHAIDAVTDGMGDAMDTISYVFMHSAVRSYLKKIGELDVSTVVVNDVPMEMASFMGKRVFVDDTFTLGTGNYLTVFAAPTAFGFGEVDLGTEGTEIDRNVTGKKTVLVSSKAYTIHPRGLKWVGTAASKSGPTNAELSTTTNWEVGFSETKNIPLVGIKHKINQVDAS